MEIERAKTNEQFKLPVSCKSFPELVRLVYVMGLKDKSGDSSSSPGIVPGSVPPPLFSRPGVPPSYAGPISQPLMPIESHMTGANKPVSNKPGALSRDEVTPLSEAFLDIHETHKASNGGKEQDAT